MKSWITGRGWASLCLRPVFHSALRFGAKTAAENFIVAGALADARRRRHCGHNYSCRAQPGLGGGLAWPGHGPAAAAS